MATAEGEEKKAGRRTSRRPRSLPGAQRDSERPAPGGSLEGGLLPDLLRRGLSLGFTGFFMTEEAVRRALGESVPREWLEFFVAQSDRTRAELVERLSREFGRVFSAIEPVEILTPAPRRPDPRDPGEDPAPERRPGRRAAERRGSRARHGARRRRVSEAAPGPPRGAPSLAGVALSFAAVAFAAFVYFGIGPRPKSRVWWEPSGRVARALGETSLAPLVEEPAVALGAFGLAAAALAAAVFATTRSALARWLAVSAALATLSFVFYALEARFVWTFFRWRWTASLVLIALAVGAAATAPLLAASWLRLGWRARVASYLPVFLAVLVYERNVTGTDPSLQFSISPWPFVQIFGLEVVAACLGALALGVGLGLAAAARARRGGAALFWPLGAAFSAGLPAGALALAAYRELLPFRADGGLALALGGASLAAFALAASVGVARRAEPTARRALVWAVGGALVLAPIALGQTLAQLDYVETRDGRAGRIIEALARHRAAQNAYPDDLAELVDGGELDHVPAPRIGFPGLGDQQFVYQNFGESYILEFSAPRWIQCAYNPPYEDEGEEEGAEADDAGSDGLGEGAWSCPSKPPELW